MKVIELQNVGKVFDDEAGRTEVLKDVSLSVKKGEFVAIMGTSGSGKSTLMNILGLLDTPTAGTYLLDEKPVEAFREKKLSELRRVKIGFIFQSFNLITRLSVATNVELPMIYARLSKQDRRKRTAKLLKLVGLSHRAKNRPSQISGGEAQRAAIARALANQPEVILADEPTGNLDSQTSAIIMNSLVKLHNGGTTVVVITHDRAIAAYAQRIIYLHDGQIRDRSQV